MDRATHIFKEYNEGLQKAGWQVAGQVTKSQDFQSFPTVSRDFHSPFGPVSLYVVDRTTQIVIGLSRGKTVVHYYQAYNGNLSLVAALIQAHIKELGNKIAKHSGKHAVASAS